MALPLGKPFNNRAFFLINFEEMCRAEKKILGFINRHKTQREKYLIQ
jgi:hypothetical protein